MSNRDPVGGENDVRSVDRVSRSTRQRWLRTLDMLLIILSGGVLVPSVLLNIILWRERLLGIALFDPAVGGDPAWRTRPLFVPLVVAAAATARLFISRRQRPASGRLARAHAIVLGVALLMAAAALIPEPTVFPT